MNKFIMWLFGIKKDDIEPASNDIKSVTLGERDEDGYCDTYVNGEKTNLRMLTFTPEQVERLQNIGKRIQEENRLKNNPKK